MKMEGVEGRACKDPIFGGQLPASFTLQAENALHVERRGRTMISPADRSQLRTRSISV